VIETVKPFSERLSSLDASFLRLEDPDARMHEGCVMVFDPGPLRGEDGGVDVAAISRAYEANLSKIERYRQRLAEIPFFGQPVWVDDPKFNIRYHIRHISLPRPGDLRLLKRVVGHILSQPLDHRKPLWEAWIVEGLEDERFALVAKVHHCMVDAVSGMNILAALLHPDPDARLDAPTVWKPRPVPHKLDLVAGEVRRRIRAPFELLAPLRSPARALRSAYDVAVGISEAARLAWPSASQTIFNPDHIGPHRRFDWSSVELGHLKDVKNHLGGTVNDVVLAAVSGALGEFLRAHRTPPRKLDFRALVPVSIRTQADADKPGNHLAMVMVALPVGERDPRRRLRRVIEATQMLKHSKQALAIEWLEEITDSLASGLLGRAARVAARGRPFNIAVTNVPGPQSPLYMLGARLCEMYPVLPLFSNQALSIAVISYDGKTFWGFNSDWDTLPDLHDLVERLAVEVEQLRKAQAPVRPRGKRRRSQKSGGATASPRRTP
jgi:WS/DGAT/MGAT family acyltransferase